MPTTHRDGNTHHERLMLSGVHSINTVEAGSNPAPFTNPSEKCDARRALARPSKIKDGTSAAVRAWQPGKTGT